MRALAIALATLALAACSQKADDTAATEDATAESPMPADTTAMADTIAPGTYEVAMADGTTATTVISADGTFVDTMPDGTEVRGTVARRDGLDCFDPEGDEPEVCWTPAPPGEDGSFTATATDGTVVTVKKTG